MFFVNTGSKLQAREKGKHIKAASTRQIIDNFSFASQQTNIF